LLGVPAALLSIVDHDRQFFKSQIALPDPWASVRQTPLSHSFCQWVVSSNEELAVEDASKLPGLQANRAIDELGVISYAGVPVALRGGAALGAFCAIDSKPRSWSATDLLDLQNLARMAEGAMLLETLGASGDTAIRSQANATLISNAAQLVRRHRSSLGDESMELLLGVIEMQAQDMYRPAALAASR
jgi:GAF domain-containing protein